MYIYIYMEPGGGPRAQVRRVGSETASVGIDVIIITVSWLSLLLLFVVVVVAVVLFWWSSWLLLLGRRVRSETASESICMFGVGVGGSYSIGVIPTTTNNNNDTKLMIIIIIIMIMIPCISRRRASLRLCNIIICYGSMLCL